ncbi:hypothetical protein X777_12243 [Ooceraea biroi]|uniref:MADF domain-containing protein n=1 Tax=Ooceraea biroi TaxID=2015173 RepID=A0A026W0J1_OOCBI|nr:hypothetical protein X777_12243 [Ooceraea biroi]
MCSQDINLQDSIPIEVNIEADAIFIDIVKNYPDLCKNLKDFKDKNVRERAWVDIASILNCSGMWNYTGLQVTCMYRNTYVKLFTVEDYKRRWLRLRERFSKEQRL